MTSRYYDFFFTCHRRQIRGGLGRTIINLYQPEIYITLIYLAGQDLFSVGITAFFISVAVGRSELCR